MRKNKCMQRFTQGTCQVIKSFLFRFYSMYSLFFFPLIHKTRIPDTDTDFLFFYFYYFFGLLWLFTGNLLLYLFLLGEH